MTATAKAITALFLALAVGCGREANPIESPAYEDLESTLGWLSARFPEVTDTAVRDSVLVAVYCSVIHAQPVPRDFGMFSPAGDRAVRSIVLGFTSRTRDATDGLTRDERIEAVWGDSWGEEFYLVPSDCAGS